MPKISTVNVIEVCTEGVDISITSFPCDNEGNKEAEELFWEKCVENGGEDEDRETLTEDGYYEGGVYSVFLVHSEMG